MASRLFIHYYQKNSLGAAGNAVLFGSAFILLSLIANSDTFLFARFGAAENLASFSLINVWVESGFNVRITLFVNGFTVVQA